MGESRVGIGDAVMSEGPVQSRGPGPFVTHRFRPLADGSHLVASSRRHRKGLRPHRVPDERSAHRPVPTHSAAFHHLWAPRRFAWWVAVVFATGSALFTLGGVAAAWPGWVPSALRDGAALNRVFVIGAIFFTLGGWLQWLEAVNGDVAEAFGSPPLRRWRWFGWRPRNLGYLASLVQLLGTIMFNFNTIDATFAGLSPEQENLFVWAPNMVGCVCFLLSSGLVYTEVSQGSTSVAPRSVSWWIAVVNLLGSVAFQVSALCSVVLPGQIASAFPFWANFYTALGGLCFLIGSYLMIPELFDEKKEGAIGG